MTQAGWNGDVRSYADGNDTPVADVLATRSFTTSSGGKRTLLAQRALRDSQPDRTTVEYPIRFIREERARGCQFSRSRRPGGQRKALPATGSGSARRRHREAVLATRSQRPSSRTERPAVQHIRSRRISAGYRYFRRARVIAPSPYSRSW